MKYVIVNIQKSICLLIVTSLLLPIGLNKLSAQSNLAWPNVYAREFDAFRSNSYIKQLIKHSEVKPPNNWKNYKGGELRTPDHLFKFDESLGCYQFPTHSSKTNNDYLIYYFVKKSSHFPTLFSLYNYYQPSIESAIKKQELPKELGYIPIICSSFNPNSNNGIGGVGYWHLNYAPAVKYGLRIDEYVDERKDIAKASRAATAYLKELHKKYNDWEMALAAYSSGVVNISKAMKRHNVSSYKDLLPHLPKETKDFVQPLWHFILFQVMMIMALLQLTQS